MIRCDFDKYNNIKYDYVNLDYLKEQLIKDNKMLGWYDLDVNIISDIVNLGNNIKNKADVFLLLEQEVQ